MCLNLNNDKIRDVISEYTYRVLWGNYFGTDDLFDDNDDTKFLFLMFCVTVGETLLFLYFIVLVILIVVLLQQIKVHKCNI